MGKIASLDNIGDSKKEKKKRLSLLMFKWGYIWIEVSKYSAWEGSCDSLINVKQIECLEENDR